MQCSKQRLLVKTGVEHTHSLYPLLNSGVAELFLSSPIFYTRSWIVTAVNSSLISCMPISARPIIMFRVGNWPIPNFGQSYVTQKYVYKLHFHNFFTVNFTMYRVSVIKMF